MASINCKPGATFVAYFDVITSTIALCLLGGGVIWLMVKFADEDVLLSASSYTGTTLRIGIASLATYIGIILWAGTQLFQAVQEGADQIVALRKAKYWRNVHIVFLILGIIGAVGNLAVYSWVQVIVRGIFLFIVWKFIAALEYERSVSLPVRYAASAGSSKDASCEPPPYTV